jgi:hypothetical protein
MRLFLRLDMEILQFIRVNSAGSNHRFIAITRRRGARELQGITTPPLRAIPSGQQGRLAEYE